MNAQQQQPTAQHGLAEFAGRTSGGWGLAAIPLAISAVVLVVLGTRMTFFADDWAFVLHRGLDADSILEPSNGHFVALSVVVFRALISAFGLESQFPFRIALALFVVALGSGVFVFVRRRLGVLPAAMATSVLVFLGPAYEALLWDFQIGFVGSLAAGLWALILLDADTVRRDWGACLLLVVAVMFSNVGVAFIPAAVLVAIVRRHAADLWIAAVPTLVFAIWWLAYGRDADNYLTLKNILRLPEYVADSAAAGLASLSGLNSGVLTTYNWGPPLLLAAVAGCGAWLYLRRPQLSWLLVVASPALAFWALTGASFIPGREPVASRYQLISVTFLVLIAAELFRTVRWRAAGFAAIAGLGLIVVLANVQILKSQGNDFLLTHADYAKTSLGALDIMRGHVGPKFRLTEQVSRDPYLAAVTAGSYYRQAADHGTPAYSPHEIEDRPPDRREAADSVLAAGYALHLEPTDRRAYRAGRACKPLGQEPDLSIVLEAGATARFANRSAAPAVVSASRFAARGTAIGLGQVPPKGVAVLRLPKDRAQALWRVYATVPLTIGLCAGG